jgi:hypothetical protein
MQKTEIVKEKLETTKIEINRISGLVKADPEEEFKDFKLKFGNKRCEGVTTHDYLTRLVADKLMLQWILQN